MKKQIEEKAISRCKDAILLGFELDYILALFYDLDADLVREMYEKYSKKSSMQ